MRIMYWNNSCLEPDIEAISKEVFALARHFSSSWMFGVNPHYTFRWSARQRYVGFHPATDPFLRMVIPILERWADINHVYGEPCPWIFHKTLKSRPVVLTIASEKGEENLEFFDRCKAIVVQTETYRRRLLDQGIDEKKIELVYPGVDLNRFAPIDRPHGIQATPTLLFATAPRSVEEMEKRGVNLLLRAAQKSPDLRYRLLYRPWRTGYTSLKPTQQSIKDRSLVNVHLTNTAVPDMADVFRQSHFLVIPYMTPDGGKECPNSLVEGLVCGLPALISSAAPFAYFVEQHKCGVVFDPDPEGLIAAVEEGVRRYAELSSNALEVSRVLFSQDRVLHHMAQVYRSVS